MAGYNNYGNYGNYANYPTQGQYAGIGNMNTIPQQTNNFGYQNAYQQNQMPVQDTRFQFVDYVSGRAGADAYQLPTGVTRALLFDNDTNRFYVKTYDNNGRPRVVEDNDFQTHVDPEPKVQQPNVDLSRYATKDDIREMIDNALSNISLPNMSSYVTQSYLDKQLSNLSVGNGGRIVRNNEHNA